MVFQLMDGFQTHHWKPSQKQFKNKGGKLATNLKGKKNIESHWNTWKTVSTIITDRLLKHLRRFGSKAQFGMIGCQEAQHTLKKALLLRRQHGLETYALFVDLVKAFDTVQHPLLFDILKKY